MVTNLLDSERQLGFDFGGGGTLSEFLGNVEPIILLNDSSGNQYPATGLSFGTKKAQAHTLNTAASQALVGNVPVRVTVQFDNAETFSAPATMRIVATTPGQRYEWDRFVVTFRDVVTTK